MNNDADVIEEEEEEEEEEEGRRGRRAMKRDPTWTEEEAEELSSTLAVYCL